MSKFKPSEREDSKSGSPHKDWAKNVSFFESMLEKVEMAPDVKVELQEETPIGSDKYLCVMFVFGPIGERKGAFNVSFHQAKESFESELKAVFNTMRDKKLLKRRS